MFETVSALKKATIKIYVSNLGAYNGGTLTGKWTTLPVDDVQEIFKEDRETFGGADDYGEEYFITDYEAPFHIDEYDDINELNKLARLWKEDGIEDIEDVYHNLNNRGDVVPEAIEWDEFVYINFHDAEPEKILEAGLDGHVNYSDDYLRFDGNGNLESLSLSDWYRDLNKHRDEIVENYAEQNGIRL